MDELIYKSQAIDAVCTDCCGGRHDCRFYPDCDNLKSIKALPTVQPLKLSCDGCKFSGGYDDEFPCNSCIRKEKDYYAAD